MRPVSLKYVILGVFFLDQAIKFLVIRFDWLYVCNRGVAFGLEFNKFLVYFLNFLIICLLLWGSRRVGDFYGEKWVIYLIIGAAISNFFDRVARGCVIDYIDLRVWPVFNLADAIIVLGVGYWVLGDFLKKKKSD
ncbi:MAG: signal peptidase II [Patescibacteria group bacterium]